MSIAKRLEKLANDSQVTFIQYTPYHIRLIGLHSVNVYETKSVFYINGMKCKERFDKSDLPFLIKLAKGETEFTFTKEKVKRRSFDPSRRERIWQRNPACYFCKDLIRDPADASIEHKIPLSKGGSNRPDNLAVSHKECNQARGASIGIKQ